MQESILKKGKKKFYPIAAPALFNEEELGEVPLYDLKDAIGRRVKVNLMTLTNDPKRQNINLTFQINAVDEQKARTEIIGYHLVPSSIRRMVKRGKIRMDDSFIVETNDKRLVRIKPFMVTAGLARSAALKSLGRKTRSILKKNIAKMSYEDFIKELISNRLQNDLREQLKKTYPLAVCQIRAMEVEKEKKGETTEKAEEEKKIIEEVEEEEKIEEKEEIKEEIEEIPKEEKEAKKEKIVKKKEEKEEVKEQKKKEAKKEKEEEKEEVKKEKI